MTTTMSPDEIAHLLEAIQTLSHGQIDLILLDLNLPASTRPGAPMTTELSGISLPSVIRQLAPIRQFFPIFAPFRTIEPIPTSEPSPTSQPCSITIWPMVTFLPMVSGFEKDGTYTNLERRVQRVRAAVPPPGQARHEPSGALAELLAELATLRATVDELMTHTRESKKGDAASALLRARGIEGGRVAILHAARLLRIVHEQEAPAGIGTEGEVGGRHRVPAGVALRREAIGPHVEDAPGGDRGLDGFERGGGGGLVCSGVAHALAIRHA